MSQVAENGNLVTFQSHQKGSHAENPKESAKGFKILLKFASKSHGTSATTDNYEDVDHLSEGEGRIPEDEGGNIDVTTDVGVTNTHLSRITSGATLYSGAYQGRFLLRFLLSSSYAS